MHEILAYLLLPLVRFSFIRKMNSCDFSRERGCAKARGKSLQSFHRHNGFRQVEDAAAYTHAAATYIFRCQLMYYNV